MDSLAEAAALKIVKGETPTAEERAAYDRSYQQVELRNRARERLARDAGALIRGNIAKHGDPAKRHFSGLSQDTQRALGIRALIGPTHKVPRSRGQHGRASGAAPVRTARSRRSPAATRAGPDDDSGNPDPDGEAHPLAAGETAGVTG